MKDVQSTQSFHPVEIERVGIKDLHYPVRILKKDNSHQSTIADIYVSVSLPADQRGTHMSRFIEVIERYKHDVNGPNIQKMIKELSKIFDTTCAFVKVSFPYFIMKRAPVSRKSSIMEVKCGFSWELDKGEMIHDLFVEVPVTTLCPCSKEISKYGAHNQRAYIKLEISPIGDAWIWFEDMVDLVENCASAPIYPLLKRKDEKFVTEQAYDNPRFVEDLIREVYTKTLERYKKDISNIRIHVEADESIHTHKAFAYLEEEVNGRDSVENE